MKSTYFSKAKCLKSETFLFRCPWSWNLFASTVSFSATAPVGFWRWGLSLCSGTSWSLLLCYPSSTVCHEEQRGFLYCHICFHGAVKVVLWKIWKKNGHRWWYYSLLLQTCSQPLMVFVAKVCFPRDHFLLTVMAMTKLQNQIFTHANESVKK